MLSPGDHGNDGLNDVGGSAATIGKTGCALAGRCYAAGQLPALLAVESLRLADADLDRLTEASA